MESRPRTAPLPCRRAEPERWTEVDAMVRDMLSSVATTATSSDLATDALHRRPQTACACVQQVAVVSRCADSSDEDSDGAEFDDDDVPAPVASSSASGYPSSGRTAEADILNLEAEYEASAGSREPRDQELLSREDWLLLGGGWRAARGNRSDRASGGGRPEDSEGSTILPPSTSSTIDARPVSSAGSVQISSEGKNQKPCFPTEVEHKFGSRLPKQCAFVGGGASASQPTRHASIGGGGGYPGGLRPNAAKMSSHNSWAAFKPMRWPGLAPPTPTASGVRLRGAKPAAEVPSSDVAKSGPAIANAHSVSEGSGNSATAVGSAAVVSSVAPSESASAMDVATGASTVAAQAPLAEAPAEQEGEKKRGPKYRVIPGGSRPAKKAPAHEFLVVEFRTEPRVVPDRKKAHANQAKHAFRPDSRTWATDRKAIAAVAG